MKRVVFIFLSICFGFTALLWLSYAHEGYQKRTVDFPFLGVLNIIFCALSIFVVDLQQKRKIKSVLVELYTVTFLRFSVVVLSVFVYLVVCRCSLSLYSLLSVLGLYIVYIFTEKFLLLQSIKKYKILSNTQEK